ncbi:hypothetical protein [uncultured Ferrovibrio sp.]|jgi:hypothetical protein|uniref:hypothetical protein n=1 Tax=uncultured Ferrovibrio sp. TaxID=1576913 RepID=UPI00262D2845|nr:hypothetical protein [uncultured Ferrovibrio sp.]
MPIVIIILLAFLVAQFGFWDTFTGILGGIGVLILVGLTFLALAAAAGMLALRRLRGR